MCSNQGTCDDSIGSCICNEGFEGNICEGENNNQSNKIIVQFVGKINYYISDRIFLLLIDVSCPGSQQRCNGNGFCDLTNGVCTCDEAYQGLDCSGNN